MSSGLVLCAPLPDDSSAFTPLKPVTMSGEPGEDTSVFEDIKPPARAPDNPPDLAQVRRRPPVRCSSLQLKTESGVHSL